MDCMIGLVLLILGIILLVAGKISFGSKEASGLLVRLAGGALILGGILGFTILIFIGFNAGLQAGLNNRGNEVDQQQLKAELQKKLTASYWWVPYATCAVGVVSAVAMVLVSIKPKEKPGRRRPRRQRDQDEEEEDEEEDRPRRRRRRDEDND